jgi:surfactin synthase thioesterase subunit
MSEISLILLPYAGGGSEIFREWRATLPAWINPILVDLPGHGKRCLEGALSDWNKLMDTLLPELTPYLDRPFALFGHSMGALVGLELAQVLQRRYQTGPVWFCASGCVAPSLRQIEHKWIDCPETEVVGELHALGGTPPEVLENEELLELIMPMIRADFHLCGTYQPPPRSPLRSPMLVLGGVADGLSYPASNLSAWSTETSGRCRIEMIHGGHFFLNTHREQVIRLIADDLARSL